MTKQVRNEVVESKLVDIKSAVICNKINHVDDTVNVFFYAAHAAPSRTASLSRPMW